MLKFALKELRGCPELNFIGEWCTSEVILEPPPVESDSDPLNAWFGTTRATADYENNLDRLLHLVDIGS